MFIFSARSLGYFALTADRIPGRRALRLTELYFLSGFTFTLSNLAFLLGPAFYFLYAFVSSEYAMGQAMAEEGITDVTRLAGLAPAFTGILCALLARYGITGIAQWRKPWRALLFAAALVGNWRLAGFAPLICSWPSFSWSNFIWRACIAPFTCRLPSAWRCWRLFPIVAFAQKMPLVVQRAVCFLPVKVDSSVASEARGSWEWRVNMWKTLVPDIPQYLLVGKGYRIDPEDLYLVDIANQLGLTRFLRGLAHGRGLSQRSALPHYFLRPLRHLRVHLGDLCRHPGLVPGIIAMAPRRCTV